MTISKNRKIRIWTKENIDQQRYNRLLWETIFVLPDNSLFH